MDYEKFYLDDGKFDLKSFNKAGLDVSDVISEIILVIAFIVFFGYGIYNLYFVIGYLRDILSQVSGSLTGITEILKDYSLQSIIIVIAIYLITLGISYLVVKFFGQFAGIFMYGSAILQIVLFTIIWFYLSFFKYRWVFLIPVAIQLIVMIFWHKKFKLAIQYMKMSCLVVWKQRKLLLPQFAQTFWIIILSIFQVVTTIATFFSLNKINPTTVEFRQHSITITATWIYVGYTALFIFLVYIVLFVTLGMKILMVHHWYRGGNLSFWAAWRVVQRRWTGLIGYAFSSTLIHSIQLLFKLAKKNVSPKSILSAVKFTDEITPQNPMEFDKGTKKSKVTGVKKRIPIHERIWMGLNYFTLPAILIEDKIFITSIFRSMRMVVRNIVDLYIKHANVNKLFRLMQYITVALNAVAGAVLGWVFGYLFGLNKTLTVILSIPIFLWIGGTTAVLVLNDLNMAYITIMYIHSLDEMNDKKGYTRFELEKKEYIERKLIEKQKKKEEKSLMKQAKNGTRAPVNSENSINQSSDNP